MNQIHIHQQMLMLVLCIEDGEILKERIMNIQILLGLCLKSFFFLIDEIFNLIFFFCCFNRKQTLSAKLEAEKDGVIVPLTLEDYCIKPKHKPPQEPQVIFMCFIVKFLVELC